MNAEIEEVTIPSGFLAEIAGHLSQLPHNSCDHNSIGDDQTYYFLISILHEVGGNFVKEIGKICYAEKILFLKIYYLIKNIFPSLRSVNLPGSGFELSNSGLCQHPAIWELKSYFADSSTTHWGLDLQASK